MTLNFIILMNIFEFYNSTIDLILTYLLTQIILDELFD